MPISTPYNRLPSFSTVSGNSIMTGYVKVGDDAAVPLIKTKTLTGTTSDTQGGAVSIAHGISNPSKILLLWTQVEYATDVWINENYEALSGYQFGVYTTDTNILVANVDPNSGSILQKPIKIFIIYKE